MPTLYTLTVNRKSRVAFSNGRVNIYIDGHFRGQLRKTEERRFQLTKDAVTLYVKDVSPINIIPVTSRSVHITPQEAKGFVYQVEYGISDAA